MTFVFLRWQQPPVPPIFDDLPYPPPRGSPNFFYLFFFFGGGQNDRKGCTLDYLHGLGHFVFGLGTTGKNSLGDSWFDKTSFSQSTWVQL